MEHSDKVKINWTQPELELLEVMKQEKNLSFDASEPLTDDQLDDLYDIVEYYRCINDDGNFVMDGKTADDMQNQLIDVMRPRGLV